MSVAALRRCATLGAAAALLVITPGPAHADVGGGNVSVSWELPGTPSSGLTDITYPITVNSATAHRSGIYFAQQFGFTNAADVGYTGLQPRENSGGAERFSARFSSFVAGIPSCAQMPRADVVFGGPTSTSAGGLNGTSRANYEYGDCVGESNYRAENQGSGTHITRGYVS